MLPSFLYYLAKNRMKWGKRIVRADSKVIQIFELCESNFNTIMITTVKKVEKMIQIVLLVSRSS
jgi:hypothetical protein